MGPKDIAPSGLVDSMSHSLARVLVHLVFSTKYRARVLTAEVRRELHPYMAAVLERNDCVPLRVGGVEDHVHLLFGLSRTMTLSKVVEIAKTSSSKWLKTKGPEFANFHWQCGYGAFSVQYDKAEIVVRYIENQETHHRKISFQDELRQSLDHHKLTYDERYLWD